jgi:hypothetical protein
MPSRTTFSNTSKGPFIVIGRFADRWQTSLCAFLGILVPITYFLFGEIVEVLFGLVFLWAVILAVVPLRLVSPRATSDKFWGWIRTTVATATLATVGLWLLSISVFVQVPYEPEKAIAVGGGSFHSMSGCGMDGNPLRFIARTGWSGWTAGVSGAGTATWTREKRAHHEYRAVWPLLLALVLTTLILVPTRRRRFPPGCCVRCAYDLTGNVSGVCPECGTKVENLKA